jgi:hypothetical protein
MVVPDLDLVAFILFFLEISSCAWTCFYSKSCRRLAYVILCPDLFIPSRALCSLAGEFFPCLFMHGCCMPREFFLHYMNVLFMHGCC